MKRIFIFYFLITYPAFIYPNLLIEQSSGYKNTLSTRYLIKLFEPTHKFLDSSDTENSIITNTLFVNELLDLNDNQVPQDWNLVVRLPIVNIANGRLNAYVTDADGWLEKNGTVAPGTDSISLRWDGQYLFSSWGITNYVELKLGTNLLRFTSSFHTNQPNNGRIRALMQFVPTAGTNTTLFDQFFPQEFGNFYFKVTVSNNKLKFTGTRKVDNQVIFSQTFDSDTLSNFFQLSSITGLRFGVHTTTENDNWIDNLQVEVHTAQPADDSSLVGYWTFDGGNGIDSSRYHNNASEIFGGVSFAAGKKGLGAKFGGTSNPGHIKIPNSTSLQFSNKLSVAFWMKFTSYSGTYNSHSLIAKDHDVRGFRVQGTGTDNRFHAGFFNGPYYQSNFGIYNDYPQYTLGDWIHVAVVIEGNSGKLYFNGVLDTAVIGNQVDFRQANTLDLYFGKYSDSWYPYNGMLDEVRMYNRVLSNQEIVNLAGVTPQNPSVTIISPNGGETLLAGQVDTIKWTSVNIESAKLEYSTDGGFNWLLITGNTPAVGGSYSWLVPNTPSLNCKVRISDINSSQNDTSNFSFQIALDSTLIAYYPFNGNTNDESGNGYHATNSEATLALDRFGNPNKAYYFNGTSSKIQANSKIITAPFTVSVWLKTDQNGVWPASEAIVVSTTYHHGGYGKGILLRTSNKSAGFSKFPATTSSGWGLDYGDSTKPINDNNWHQMVGTWDGTVNEGGVKWYIDGKLVMSGKSHDTSLIHNFNLKIGHSSDGPYNYFLKGSIDDLRIYNRVLNQKEIGEIYHEGGWDTIPVIIATPTLITPSNADTNQSLTPTLSWSSVTGATSYRLQVSANSGFTSFVYDDSTITLASKTLPSSLVKNTQYYWRVRSKNSGGISSWSQPFNFKTINPTISLITPNGGENFAAGKTYQISWSSQFVQGVKLELSTNNGLGWSSLTSLGSGVQSYNWTISAGIISASCKIKISDETDASINDISSAVFTIFEYPSVIQVNRQFSFSGTTENSYRMIGLPGNVTIPVTSVITGTQKSDWQAYRDNGVISANRADYLIEHTASNPLSFTLGGGLWILSKNIITISKQVSNVVIDKNNYAIIPLQSNWNIITNPFDRTIQWDKILTANSITMDPLLYSFNGSWINFNSAMKPYEGYLFKNHHGLTSLKIPYDLNGSITKESFTSTPLKISDNKISLSLVQGSEVKSQLIVAIDSASSEDFDSTDYSAPPSSFEDVSIIIKNQNLKTAYKSLFAESRPMNGDGQIFDLQLKNVTGEELKFDFTGMDKFKDYEVYLFDARLKKYYNLKEKNSILSPAYVREGKFSLLIGKSSFIESEKAKNIVNEYSLLQNYPNPFNPKTVIMYSLKAPSNVVLTVYDITGSIVAKLVDGYLSEGYHEAVFNADNLASGIYIYRLEVKNGNNMVYSSTRKMVVTK